jgi:uncharacterized membrane protein YfcA
MVTGVETAGSLLTIIGGVLLLAITVRTLLRRTVGQDERIEFHRREWAAFLVALVAIGVGLLIRLTA